MNKLETDWVSEFLIGSTWINLQGYKVQILDYGDGEVWLLYLENQNKCGWPIPKFLEEYKPSHKV